MLTNSNELLGQALGTCTLKRLIGRGGMGAVYLAQQSRPRRTVAVKVLLPHLLDARPRDEFLARFRREADAIAALDHINIMPIYEYGEQGDAAYLVMPYVMGGTLRERLEVQPIPPIQNVVAVVEQVAAGLDSAHGLGIIHRDLKPGNILFHADGRILITDFGLAKMLKDATEQDSGAHALTSAGSIIGTPEYLSPEQGTGNPTDYHTDIYSLGVVLFQMLAGRVPFTGTTPVAVAIKHALQEPPLITEFNPAIPHSIEAVVMKALAKAPEQRFSSAGELARALRLATSNESATTIWRVPDPKLPSVPTMAATDKPKLIEPIQAEEKELKQEDNAEPSQEAKDSSDEQNTDKKLAIEAKPSNETPQEETRPEQVTTLPTLLIGPDRGELHNAPTWQELAAGKDELHNAPTWQEPAANKQEEVRPLVPPAIIPLEATQEDNELETKAFLQEAELPTTEQPQHARTGANRTGASPVPTVPGHAQQRSSARRQPIWKMLVAVFLILLIIVGGLAAYTHLVPALSTPNSRGTAIGKATSTPSSQGQTPTATAPPVAIPSAIQAGAQIYGTHLPFLGCDKQGGQWTNASNAKVTCNANGSQIINTSGHLMVVNLNQLPINQYPGLGENFIVQVQITINANSQGAFGIDFVPQTGDNAQDYFAYLLNAAGGHTFNLYDAQGNILNMLTTGQAPPLSVPTSFTLDIGVTGINYASYIDGKDTLDRAQTGSQYTNRTIGLAVDTNANITFSNFAVYASA